MSDDDAEFCFGVFAKPVTDSRNYIAEELRAKDLKIAALKDECRGRAENEDRLGAEIERLTKLLDHQFGTPCEQIRHQQELEELRNEIIEECAAVADSYWRNGPKSKRAATHKEIAAAIRALKDKP